MNPVTRMMKRYIKTPLKYVLPLLFIGVLVLASTAGCVTNTTTKNESGGGSGNAGVDVIINSKQVSGQLGSGYLTSTPGPGHQYLIFNVTVKNLNDQDADIGNPYYFTLTTSDGSVYEHASSSSYLDNAIQSVSHTSPGEKVTGQVAFEIPQSATPSKLQYDDYSNKVMVNIESGTAIPAAPGQITSNQKVVGDNTTFTGAGFSITYPTSLKTDAATSNSTDIKLYVYLAPNNTAVDSVSVGTSESAGTLTDWTTSNLNSIQSYTNYTLGSSEDSTVANHPAHTVVWQATVPERLASGSKEDVSIKMMQIYMINNNVGYILSYKTLPSDYNTYLAQAQQIINSFRFT